MKTSQKTIVAFALIFAVLITACDNNPFNRKPRKPHTAPQPDTELQTSLDVVYATRAIADIDMICGFIGEDNRYPEVFVHSPESKTVTNSAQGILLTIRQPDQNFISASFNETHCRDGKLRHGTITMNYSNPANNTEYYHDYGFYGDVALLNYIVGDWSISTKDNSHMYIYNLLPGPGYDRTKTQLSWLIEGSFEFKHNTDPSRNLTWTGKITKTLTNSTDNAVFNPARQIAIDWMKASIAYKVSASGVTNGDVPYTFETKDPVPMVREFTCSPEGIGGAKLPGITTWRLENHPFVKGIAYFNTGEKYQREIYFANDENPTSSEYICDNTGIVRIKGIGYKVEFPQ